MEDHYPRTAPMSDTHLLTRAEIWAQDFERHEVPAQRVAELYQLARNRRAMSDASKAAFAPVLDELIYEWSQIRVAQSHENEITRTQQHLAEREARGAATTVSNIVPGSAQGKFFANWGGAKYAHLATAEGAK